MIAKIFVRDRDEAERMLEAERLKLLGEIDRLLGVEWTFTDVLLLANLSECLVYTDERLAYIATTKEKGT